MSNIIQKNYRLMGQKFCSCGNNDISKNETNLLAKSDCVSTSRAQRDYKTQINKITYNNQANRIIKAYRHYKRKQHHDHNGFAFSEAKSRSSGFFNPSTSTCPYIGHRNLKGLKEGFGIQKWKDGTKYIGQFNINKACGWGMFYHIDGDKYSGSFMNDRANGYGVYIHDNGAVYEGFWQDDCQNNIGFELWCDSSTYKGNYNQGKKDGIGTYVWQDKTMYQGEWKENNIHGYGIYYFCDGRQYIGQWENNQMHGYGEFTWKEGKKYCGFYKDDKKEGFGIYFWPSSRFYIGFWKEGKQHGIAKFIQGNIVKYGLWISGYKDKWFDSEKEFYDNLHTKDNSITRFFQYDINQIKKFMEID